MFITVVGSLLDPTTSLVIGSLLDNGVEFILWSRTLMQKVVGSSMTIKPVLYEKECVDT